MDDPPVTIEKLVPDFARIGMKSIADRTDPVTAPLKDGAGVLKTISLDPSFAPEDLANAAIPDSLVK